MKPLTKLRIGLAWHHVGHPNLGVDALTRASFLLLSQAAELAGIEFDAITLGSAAPRTDEVLSPQLQIGPRLRFKPMLKGRSELISEMKRCDLIIDIGEGDSWSDIYGLRRFSYQAATKLVAVSLGKPLLLAPQTIGPFKRRSTSRAADAIMNRTAAIYTRDGISSDYLRSRKVCPESKEFSDLAFALPYSPVALPPGFNIGLNVSGLLYNGGYTGKNELGMMLDYRELTHRLIEALLPRPNTRVYLVPHVIGGLPPDCDTSILPDLLERYPDLRTFETFANAVEAKSAIASLDFLVAGRMHACIAGISAGVPVVPVAYSRKFNGLMDSLSYPYYIDGAKQETQHGFEKVMNAVGTLPEVRRKACEAREVATERIDAYVGALAEMLTNIAINLGGDHGSTAVKVDEFSSE